MKLSAVAASVLGKTWIGTTARLAAEQESQRAAFAAYHCPEMPLTRFLEWHPWIEDWEVNAWGKYPSAWTNCPRCGLLTAVSYSALMRHDAQCPGRVMPATHPTDTADAS